MWPFQVADSVTRGRICGDKQGTRIDMNEGTGLKRAGAVLMFLGIALGAFGAHGLEKTLTENGRIDTWETAVFYHLIHGLAVWILGYVASGRRKVAYCFVGGVLAEGVLRWTLIFGAVALPYFAVVIANAGRERGNWFGSGDFVPLSNEAIEAKPTTSQ